MRILYYYSAQGADTGSPKVLLSLIDALDRARHDPLFWARADGALMLEMERRGVTILRGPAGEVTWRKPWSAVRRVFAMARALRGAEIDVLHANEFGWNLDIVLGAALARIPVILHVHNPASADRQNLNHAAARIVLFVSEAHLKETRHLARIADKARILHNPIDLDRFASGRSIRGQLGLHAEDVVALTLGQIVPRKGIGVLLEVARRLVPRFPRLHFLVAGPISPQYREYAEEVMRAAEAPELDGRFRFLGSRDDVPDLLASSDMFVLPTSHETFGLVVGEAMAASLPVITTRVGGIPEIVADPAAAMLLQVDDVDAFAREVERLLVAPDERRALGARGRTHLEGRFRTTAFAAQLADLYDGLVR